MLSGLGWKEYATSYFRRVNEDVVVKLGVLRRKLKSISELLNVT